MEIEVVPLARNSQRTRNNILEAAREIFLAEGYRGATVEKISQKAGVGYGTVYAHFKQGKAAILNGTTEYIWDQLQERQFGISEHCPEIHGPKTATYIEQKFYEEIAGVLRVAREHRVYLRIVREAKGESEIVRRNWELQQQSFAVEFERQLLVNQNLGLAVRLDARIISHCVCSIIWYCVWGDVLDKNDLDVEELVLHIVRLYMWGMYSTEGREKKNKKYRGYGNGRCITC